MKGRAVLVAATVAVLLAATAFVMSSCGDSASEEPLSQDVREFNAYVRAVQDVWMELGRSLLSPHPKEDERYLKLADKSWLLGDVYRWRRNGDRWLRFVSRVEGYGIYAPEGVRHNALVEWASEYRDAYYRHALDDLDIYKRWPDDEVKWIREEMKAASLERRRRKDAGLLYEHWQLSVQLRAEQLGVKLPEWVSSDRNDFWWRAFMMEDE